MTADSCAMTIALASDSFAAAPASRLISRPSRRLKSMAQACITALTAQNTLRVEAVHVVPPDFVLQQMRAVASDLEVDAIKIGMLATGPVIEAVAEGLKDFAGVPVVLDPVMIAASGDPLLDPDAVNALRSVLMPLATLDHPQSRRGRGAARPARWPAMNMRWRCKP